MVNLEQYGNHYHQIINMILTIKDRLTIIGILPSEGNLCEMVDIYDLVK